MSEGAKTLRLSKVAKEFNLSLGKIVEFLASKGQPVDSNPNAKIGDEEYRLLLKEFSSDKSAREEAETVAQNSNKLKRETIVLDEIKPKKQKEEEFDEVVIKDLTLSKKEEDAPEKTETKKENEPAIEAPLIRAENNDGPKVIGRVDLDSMNLKTKPDKKTKKEKEAERVAKSEVETENLAKEKKKKEAEQAKPETVIEKNRRAC